MQPVEDKSEVSSNEVVYWGVKDIQKSYNRLLELGAQSFEKPESVGDDIITATLKDPWDNIFGIIYNPNFKTNN